MSRSDRDAERYYLRLFVERVAQGLDPETWQADAQAILADIDGED